MSADTGGMDAAVRRTYRAEIVRLTADVARLTAEVDRLAAELAESRAAYDEVCRYVGRSSRSE